MFWIVALLLLGACEAADTSPRVPFKLNPGKPAPSEPALPAAPAEGPSSEHFDKPLDHPPIDGAASPFLGARALLRVDLDGDQDRDAIAIVTHADDTLALAVAMREGATFEPASLVAGFGLGPGCEAPVVRLQALSASKGVLSVESRCGEPKLEQPRRELVFALDRRPFLLERIELASALDASGRVLSFDLATEDTDADSHDDVVLNATLHEGTLPPVQARLVLLDRGASLAFDAVSFETLLFARAENASLLLRKDPNGAGEASAAVIALGSSLCREAEQPLVRVAGKPGLPCAASPALARARATWTAAQAARGDLGAALDGYVALSLLKPRLSKQPLADATRALLGMKARPDVTLSAGPVLSELQDPALRLPSARFVTDALLYVRRDAPVIVDLDHGTEAPAPMADDSVSDPAGTLHVSAIERGCAGLFLRIDSLGDAGALAQTVARPALAPQSAAADCVDTPQTRRRDAAGFRLLGWAPQGVLAARGREVRLVPLSIAGAATGEPRVLDPLTPRPAPLPLGRATSDGARYVWLTAFGVVVLGGPGSVPELWRPRGWDEIARTATDAAISPSGQRVAVISAGRVHVLNAGPAASATR